MYLFVTTDLPDNIILSMQKTDDGNIKIYYNSKQEKAIHLVSGYNETVQIIEDCIRPEEMRETHKRGNKKVRG